MHRSPTLQGIWAILTILTAGLLTCSCSDRDRYSYIHFEQIGSEGWDPLDVLQFEPCIADTTLPRGVQGDATLIARYTSRVTPAPFPLSVTVEDEDGEMRTDTLTVDPRQTRESRHMSSSKLGVREVRIPLRGSVRLTEGLRISISPLSERSRTRGLLNVGLGIRAPRQSSTDNATSTDK